MTKPLTAGRRRRAGLTIIELMVAMAILGVVLVVTTNLIVKNQQIAGDQIRQHSAREDLRMALVRVSELFSSAAYVYPRSQTLTLPTGATVRTGSKALAMLIPWGTPFCNDGGSNPANWYDPTSPHRDKYCAVVYTLERRSNYVGDLGRNPKASDWVLVEYLIKWVDWPVNTIPTRDFSQASYRVGVVADSVQRANTRVLLNNGSLSRSSKKPIDPVLLGYHEKRSNGRYVNSGHPEALIDNVTFEVALQYQGRPPVKDSATLFARAVPRSAPPGTGN
jgi:prepilin-type N-terminal cleavage/methylation domain-containing protein